MTKIKLIVGYLISSKFHDDAPKSLLLRHSSVKDRLTQKTIQATRPISTFKKGTRKATNIRDNSNNLITIQILMNFYGKITFVQYNFQ